MQFLAVSVGGTIGKSEGLQHMCVAPSICKDDECTGISGIKFDIPEYPTRLMRDCLR